MASTVPQALGETIAVTHSAAPTPAEWKSAVASASGIPSSYAIVKTLVFKPKSKGTTVPVVIVAHEDTETSTGPLGKKINQKDLRFASDDLYQEFFGASKDEGMLSALANCYR